MRRDVNSIGRRPARLRPGDADSLRGVEEYVGSSSCALAHTSAASPTRVAERTLEQIRQIGFLGDGNAEAVVEHVDVGRDNARDGLTPRGVHVVAVSKPACRRERLEPARDVALRVVIPLEYLGQRLASVEALPRILDVRNERLGLALKSRAECVKQRRLLRVFACDGTEIARAVVMRELAAAGRMA